MNRRTNQAYALKGYQRGYRDGVRLLRIKAVNDPVEKFLARATGYLNNLESILKRRGFTPAVIDFVYKDTEYSGGKGHDLWAHWVGIYNNMSVAPAADEAIRKAEEAFAQVCIDGFAQLKEQRGNYWTPAKVLQGIQVARLRIAQALNVYRQSGQGV